MKLGTHLKDDVKKQFLEKINHHPLPAVIKLNTIAPQFVCILFWVGRGGEGWGLPLVTCGDAWMP